MTSHHFEPGGWWRVIAPNGTIYCETSDRDEAIEKMRSGDILKRLYLKIEHEWRTESHD